METKLNLPRFSTEKRFDLYRQEVEMWEEVTSVVKEKRAMVLILSLSEGDSLREQVFENLSIADLKKDTGVKTFLDFLEQSYGKDELVDCLERYKEFRDYKRGFSQTIGDYVINFDKNLNRIVKKGMTLPNEVLAFELIRNADISKEEEKLVMTGLDFTKKEELFNQAKQSLKKFMGEGCAAVKSSMSEGPAIKLEPVFEASNGSRSKYYGRGRGSYSKVDYRSNQRYGSNGAGVPVYGKFDFDKRETSKFAARVSQRGRAVQTSRDGRNINPSSSDGKTMLCHGCGSYRHLLNNCPDRWENKVNQSVVEEDRDDFSTTDVVLFTGYDKGRLGELCLEANSSAVLDSACSSTVCGENWLEGYLCSLSEEDKDKVARRASGRTFRFGGGPSVKSSEQVTIPAVIAGMNVSIVTDVVSSDIPLLLSKNAMKAAQMTLDLCNDTATFMGTKIILNETASGHYCVPISRDTSVQDVCSVDLHKLDENSIKVVLLKLHAQFGHPVNDKLIKLMKNASVWKDSYGVLLEDIYSVCQICKQYKRSPPRPVVALPVATRFNQVVCMDLKQWERMWILHMIDYHTRFTQSVFIQKKLSAVIVDNVMMHWIGIFGIMEGLMTDNGGEFTSDEMREVASMLDIRVITTAAEVPFQNGLCERVHQVTDVILLKLREQYPKWRLSVLLKWANMARNSLQMWNGYSSHQLVYGINPNLPNVMTATIPALEETTTSNMLAEHLNALHATREAYVKSESAERIKRALRHKIRASQQVFQAGELVYYIY